MERKELLQRISFGSQVAEDERRALASYFVETDQWRRVSNDEIDVIRGEKGAGKSAIYALLLEKEAEFFDKRILITAGENPRGQTVFRDIIAEPPTSETEFMLLWKLYIIALIAREMRNYDIHGDHVNSVYGILEGEGLLDREINLASLLRRVQDIARALLKSMNIETTFSIDPSTGIPIGSAKPSSVKPPTFLVVLAKRAGPQNDANGSCLR